MIRIKCHVFKTYKMDGLVNTLENNLLMRRLLEMQGCSNKPTDFIQGEEVVTMNPIDNWDKIKPGSIGTINTIMHRYRGTASEHHEFWVVSGRLKSRYETNQILKLDTVKKFTETYKE